MATLPFEMARQSGSCRTLKASRWDHCPMSCILVAAIFRFWPWGSKSSNADVWMISIFSALGLIEGRGRVEMALNYHLSKETHIAFNYTTNRGEQFEDDLFQTTWTRQATSAVDRFTYRSIRLSFLHEAAAASAVRRRSCRSYINLALPCRNSKSNVDSKCPSRLKLSSELMM